MKKFITGSAAAILLVLSMTGCIHTDIGVKIQDNGTGSISTTIGIKKDYYDQMTSLGNEPSNGNDVFVTEHDGEEYVSFTETKEYSSFEEIEQALEEMTCSQGNDSIDFSAFDDTGDSDNEELHLFKSVEIKKSGFPFSSGIAFGAVVNPLSEEMRDIYKISMSVEMPDEITKCEGGTANGKTAVFDMNNIMEPTRLYAETKSAKIPVIVGASLIGTGAIAALVMILKHRKK